MDVEDGEERLTGICGGMVGSGGGVPLRAGVSCSVERAVFWSCWVGGGEAGFGGEYWVPASTLSLAGDLAGATGDLADDTASRAEEGDCLPNEVDGGGGGGGRAAAWRDMYRGDCEAECRYDPLLLDRTRRADAPTPEEVEEELECSVNEGEAVIIASQGCRRQG